MTRFIVIITAIVLIASCGASGSQAVANPTPTTTVTTTPTSNNLLDIVVEKSYNNLSPKLKDGLRIALLPISGDPAVAREAYDLITMQFINSGKYDMVERAEIDKILAEQQLGMTGLVDDNTAARLGHIMGAQIIITGDIPKEGIRRLAFRAIDVETSKLHAMSSERF
jgi:curli biogenesis system outer membrane secretion channel CsgG